MIARASFASRNLQATKAMVVEEEEADDEVVSFRYMRVPLFPPHYYYPFVWMAMMMMMMGMILTRQTGIPTYREDYGKVSRWFHDTATRLRFSKAMDAEVRD